MTCLALIVALLVVGTSNASAQAVTGTLLGTHHRLWRPSHSRRLGHDHRGQHEHQSTAATNESGNFVFSSIRNGVYRVEAELSGFKKAVREGVMVQVNTTIRVDLNLEVGTVAETVNVVGESPLLQTDRTDTGRIIESILLQEVPLAWNRNFQGALITVPGTTRPHRVHSEFFNAQDSLAVEVNGQSRLANNVLLDGIDNNHKTGLLTVLIPSADAIDTVSVTTSNYDAEFGRAGGAVTAVTLKSGTNQFKGSATLGGYTDSTIARNFFSGTKAPTKIVRLHVYARRTHSAEQDVLLRRLSASDRQRRAGAAFDHPADGVQEWRFQPGIDGCVQPVYRRRRTERDASRLRAMSFRRR